MQDEFVCGRDYEYCLDPTGKYIVNGDVVVGSAPGQVGEDMDKSTGVYATWLYDSKSAWGNGNMSEFIDQDDTNIVKFLKDKIGTNQNGKNSGMCMSVLNMCQDLTYTGSDGAYDPDNVVIKEYLLRTLTTIKAQQDTILADHAERCIDDVISCLVSNGYNATTGGTEGINGVALRACNSMIVTCVSTNGVGGTVNTGEAMDYEEWIRSIFNK